MLQPPGRYLVVLVLAGIFSCAGKTPPASPPGEPAGASPAEAVQPATPPAAPVDAAKNVPIDEPPPAVEATPAESSPAKAAPEAVAASPQGIGTEGNQAGTAAPAKEATPAAGSTKKAGASAAPASGSTKKAEASAAPVPSGKQVYALVPVPAPDKKTERLWKAKCSSCHGAKGAADTEKGAKMKMSDMTAASWQTTKSNEQLRKAILEGVKTTAGGVTKEMDPFKDELKPEQVDQLVTFMRWVGAPK